MKYFIETYGCQMNVHDSERMAGLLEQSGYDLADSDRDADIVVVNTCSVRERAEEKLYTRLGEIREMARETGRDPIVAVTGCGSADDRQRTTEAGFDLHLLKPVDPAVLVQLLDRFGRALTTLTQPPDPAPPEDPPNSAARALVPLP